MISQKLKTFSVTYEDNDKHFKSSKFQPNSDTEYIKKMVDYLDCEHNLITLNNKENSVFSDVLVKVMNTKLERRSNTHGQKQQ